MSANGNREYGEMTVEELEQRLRETFFYTDRIDDTVYLELERIRAALEEKQPVEFPHTAEEFWEKFERDRAGEPEAYRAETARTGAAGKGQRCRTFLRSALIAAVVVVLLAGAAFAASSFGYDLWAWVPRWNTAAGRYELAAMEASGERPILAALAELGITEPIYPAKLPVGFVITESHISKDPLLMVEQYARGKDRLSITVAPVKGVKSAVYQKSGMAMRELRNGLKAHFVFENEGTVTAICFTENYATYISGDLTVEEITGILLSIDTTAEGGGLS